MRSRIIVPAACVAFAATAAGGEQPAGRNIYKGKVKPGMYETRVTSDMTGMPGVPRGQEKSTETHTRCMTAAEIDNGIEMRSDCKVTTLKDAASGVQIVSECNDGSRSEVKFASTGSGFSSEMTTSGKEGAATYRMLMKTESRYLGACKS